MAAVTPVPVCENEDQLPLVPFRYWTSYPLSEGMLFGTVGAVQLTSSRIGVVVEPLTVKPVGASGGSFASSTVIVRFCDAVNRLSPLPPVVAVISTL